MSRYRISASARADLRQAYEYIRDNNPSAAVRILRRLTQTFERIGEMPGIGRERPDIAGELRSFPVAPYVVFYTADDSGVTIVRVVHGARSLDDLFS